MSLYIRGTKTEDLKRVMEIYRNAAVFMAENGNPGQWTGGYPGEELIKAEIEKGDSYVAAEQNEILGAFSLLFGEDETYRRIEQGRWLCSGSYGTIHRLASAGRRPGIAELCFKWCAGEGRKFRCESLRADTHENNRIMRRVLEYNGFVCCGTIYLPDGAPRIAYERAL